MNDTLEALVSEAQDELQGGGPLSEEDLGNIAHRPTLIIGLGGTGYATVAKLKRMLDRCFPDPRLRQVFQHLVLDTSPPPRPDVLRQGFIHLGGLDANAVVRRASEFPQIAEWWPSEFTSPGFIDQGANGIRAIGRLALFWGAIKVLTSLRDAYSAAADIRGFGRGRPKVYVITSLAGGTGSGMLIDLCYMVRSTVGDRLAWPSFPITGYLMLPEAFRMVVRSPQLQQRQYANAYAALRELNYWMGEGPRAQARKYCQQFVGGVEMTVVGQKPMNVCYLVDSRDPKQAFVGDMEALSGMIATAIYLEILSPLRGGVDTYFDRMDAPERQIDGQPACYSGFGIRSLHYPGHLVHSFGASKYARRLIEDGLLRAPAPGRGEDAAAQQWLSERGIQTADHLIDQLAAPGNDRKRLLAQDSGGGWGCTVRVTSTEIRGLTADAGLPVAEALARIGQHKNHELTEKAREVGARAKEMAASNRSALEGWIRQAVYDPAYGLLYAERCLRRMIVLQEELRDSEARTAAQHCQEESREATLALEYAQEQVVRAERSSFLVRRRKLDKALDQYESCANSLYALSMRAVLYDTAASVYDQLIRFTWEFLRTLEQGIASLQAAAAQLAGRSEKLYEVVQAQRAGQSTVVRDVIATPEALGSIVDLWLEQRSPAKGTGQDTSRRVAAFYQWASGQFSPEQLPLAFGQTEEKPGGDQLYTYVAQELLGGLDKLDLMAVLCLLGGESLQETEVRRLFEQADCFWRPDLYIDPMLATNLKSTVGVGYGDWIDVHLSRGESGLVAFTSADADLLRTLQQVLPKTVEVVPLQTRDNQRLVVLRSDHGLPLYAFPVIAGEYQAAYNLSTKMREQRKGVPVHCSRQWEDWACTGAFPIHRLVSDRTVPEGYGSGELDRISEVYAIARIQDHPPGQPFAVGQPYVLVAGVKTKLPEGADPDSIAAPNLDEIVQVEVVVRVEDMDIQPSWQQRYVFRWAEEAPLTEFTLVPAKAGHKLIRVEFYYQRHVLAKVQFEVDVAETQSQAPA